MTARPRLVIALVVAVLLSVFLVYNAVAGAGQLMVSVGELAANTEGSQTKRVQLTGRTVRCLEGGCAGRAAPFTFELRDFHSDRTVLVRYSGGAVPDAFREGRDLIVTGRLDGDTFIAEPGSMVTKCPSKYSGNSGA